MAAQSPFPFLPAPQTTGAGMGVMAGYPQAVNPAAQFASRFAGPAALAQIMRAQRTQQMLQQLQMTGGQNLKSPVALGANLLAEALLSGSANKAQQDVINTGTTAFDTKEQALLHQLGYDSPDQGAGAAAQPSADADAGRSIADIASGAVSPDMAQSNPLFAAAVRQSGADANAPANTPQNAPPPQADAGAAVRGQPTPPTLTPDMVAMAESRNNPNAVSPAGALGRMQVMPATLRHPGFGVAPARDFSDAEETRVGTQLLGAFSNRYGGDPVKEAVAYNWGPGNADRWIANGANPAALPRETQQYLTRLGLGPGGAPPMPAPQMAMAAAQAGTPTAATAPGGPAGGAGGPVQPTAAGMQPPPVQGGPGAAGGLPAGGGPPTMPVTRAMIQEALSENDGTYEGMVRSYERLQDLARQKVTPVDLGQGWTYDAQGRPVNLEAGRTDTTSDQLYDINYKSDGSIVYTPKRGVDISKGTITTPQGVFTFPYGGMWGSGQGGQGGGGGQATPTTATTQPPAGGAAPTTPPAGGGAPAGSAPPILHPPMDFAAKQKALDTLRSQGPVSAAQSTAQFNDEIHELLKDPNATTDQINRELTTRLGAGGVARMQMVKMGDAGLSPWQQFQNFLSTIKGTGPLGDDQRRNIARMGDSLEKTTAENARQYLAPYRQSWLNTVGNTAEEFDGLVRKKADPLQGMSPQQFQADVQTSFMNAWSAIHEKGYPRDQVIRQFQDHYPGVYISTKGL